MQNAKICIAGYFDIEFKNGSSVNNNWKQVIQTHDLNQHVDTLTVMGLGLTLKQ